MSSMKKAEAERLRKKVEEGVPLRELKGFKTRYKKRINGRPGGFTIEMTDEERARRSIAKRNFDAFMKKVNESHE